MKSKNCKTNKTVYLALLRGINVGGKNIIKMADLRSAFEGLGYDNVQSFIQSGNVVFRTEEINKTEITVKIEKLLSERFRYDSRVVVISFNELKNVVENAPEKFGKEPSDFRYDVLFIKEPLTPTEVIEVVKVRENVDSVYEGEKVVYFRKLISKASQSYLTKIITSKVYPHITIRNWNTTYNLYTLMTNY